MFDTSSQHLCLLSLSLVSFFHERLLFSGSEGKLAMPEQRTDVLKGNQVVFLYWYFLHHNLLFFTTYIFFYKVT